MIGPTCPVCDHVGHPTVVRPKFSRDEPARYYAASGCDPAPRTTRAEAEADQCAWQRGRE